jgi:hypothetical protein
MGYGSGVRRLVVGWCVGSMATADASLPLELLEPLSVSLDPFVALDDDRVELLDQIVLIRNANL